MDKRLLELLNNIPHGKLRELIGPNICDSISSYSDLIGIKDKIKFNHMLLIRFGSDILMNKKNRVLENIIWFLDEKSTIRLLQNFPELNSIEGEKVLEFFVNRIKKEFSFKNIDFSKKLLITLLLDSKKYLFEIKNEIKIDKIQTTNFPLHDFQKNIKDRSIECLLNAKKVGNHMIHMPTGSGKTKTTMEIISDFARTKSALGGFDSKIIIIWFSHSAELCEQAFDSFRQTWFLRGDSDINTIKFYGKYNLSNQLSKETNTIIFAGFDKMLGAIKSQNQEVKKILFYLRENVDLVIIDEAHRSMAKEWKKSISYFSGNSKCQQIGLTATPGRNNKGESTLLSHFFNFKKISLVNNEGVEIKNPVQHLQKRGFLAKVERKPVYSNYDLKLSSEEFNRIKKFGELKLTSILKDMVKSPKRNRKIIEQIKQEYIENRQVLIFACSLEHCFIIQSLLEIENIKSETITSHTSSSSREMIINEFKSQNLKVLINYGVLTTGFDAPSINTVIITRPVFSIVLYSQMVGRALRGPKNGGNKQNKIITLIDNINLGSVEDLFQSFNDIWN